MNLLPGEPKCSDATTQTDMAAFLSGNNGGFFQGYEVDCQPGRSIVVNCTESNRVVFEPQRHGNTVVINVEPMLTGTGQGENPARTTPCSYAVNLTSSFANRFSAESSDHANGSSVCPSIPGSYLSLFSANPLSERARLQQQESLEFPESAQFISPEWYTSADNQELCDDELASGDRLSVGSNGSRQYSGPTCCFRHGTGISHVAAEVSVPSSQKLASESVLKGLNGYNPGDAPLWFKRKYSLNDATFWQTEYAAGFGGGLAFKAVRKFMFGNFAKWAGWTDEAGKCKKVMAESEHCLDARFVLFLQNDDNGFERFSEVSQIIACVERDISKSFQGEIKIDNVTTVYETLSFKPLNEKSRKKFNQKVLERTGEYESRCDAGVVFFFRELCLMINAAERSAKYQGKRREVLEKLSKLGLLHMGQPPVSKIALLVACVNYNLAIHLIEKEYRYTGLSEFDAARRVDGELSVSTDYDRFSQEELGIMQDFLKLIDALDREVQGLLRTYDQV